jgi:radical SAM protein with 4Fe4S-binding SPASM domain
VSHLHRFYARYTAEVSLLEMRWQHERGTFPPPLAVQWIATRACDLTCAHCYSEAGHRSPHELSTEEAKALIDEIVALGCPTWVLAGGEPLLRYDLPELVAYAAERGLGWSMHTHGGRVVRHAELFRRYPPQLVAVSLDGPEALHDEIRGRPGSFTRAMEALRFLAEQTETRQVIAGTTVTRRNADHLAELADVVRASPAHGWGLHLFAPEGRGAEHSELLPTAGQLRRAAGLARRLRWSYAVELDNEWGSAGPADPLYRDHPFLCGAGRMSCVISVEGDIVPCTTTDQSQAEGNVRTHSLREVWREGFGRFRGGDPSCSDGRDCWLQTRHGHSCRQEAFDLSPTPAVSLPVSPPPPELPSAPERSSLGLSALGLAALVVLATAEPPAEAATGPGSFPSTLHIEVWAGFHMEAQESARTGQPFHVARVYRGRPAYPMTATLLRTKDRHPPAVLIAAFDELEKLHVWDGALAGELYKRIALEAPAQELAAFYARLERHVRVVDALVLAQADTGPVTRVVWMSKAGTPMPHAEVPKGLLEAAIARFPTTDAGPWVREATLPVTTTTPAMLWRQGGKTTLMPGSLVRLTRLDVLELQGPVVHPLLGTLCEGGGTVHAWNLPRFLTATARAQLDLWLEGALGGSEPSVTALAQVLPAAHEAIRQAELRYPRALGGPALRQLLVLFES